MDTKMPIVICPHCGYEYLPAEIFYPDELLGRPKDIVRDENGKIEFYHGDSAVLTENFTCYKCNKIFKAELILTVQTILDKKINFDDDYEVIIFSQRTVLDED